MVGEPDRLFSLFFFTWPLGAGCDEPVDPQLTNQVWGVRSSAMYSSMERRRARRTSCLSTSDAVTGATTRLPQTGAATGATTRLPGIHCPFCGTGEPGGGRALPGVWNLPTGTPATVWGV